MTFNARPTGSFMFMTRVRVYMGWLGWGCWPMAVLGAMLWTPRGAAEEVRAREAYAAEPFGVAEVMLPWPDGVSDDFWLVQGIGIRSPAGQAFFPVTQPPCPVDSAGTIYRGSHRSRAPRRLSVLFLFRGEEPFTVGLPTLHPEPISVAPRRNDGRHRRLLDRWWRAFVQSRCDRPVPERVIPTVLARRYGWKLDGLPGNSSADAGLTSPWRLIVGNVDSPSAASMAGAAGEWVPVKPTASRAVGKKPAQAAGGDREPRHLTDVVPRSCFYAGCETFSEMMRWLRYLEARQQDLGPCISLRSDNPQTGNRIRTQLGVGELPIPEALVDTLIGSTALIGLDLNLNDGAAIGLVLQAKNPALGIALGSLRNKIARREPGAQIQTVTQHGFSVSQLATADHRIRSFYVVRGSYHLITNCQALVDQFLQCDAATAISSLPEFQTARSELPDPQRDLLVCVSTEFQENLWRPERWLELHRRRRARQDLSELFVADRLSSLLESAGGQGPSTTPQRVEALVERQWLSPALPARADGSQPTYRDGKVLDSLRGAPGRFLPVPDVPVDKATMAEMDAYAQSVQQFEEAWGTPPPILLHVSRQPDAHDSTRAHFSVYARLAPLRPLHHAWLRQFVGEPREDTMLPPEGLAVGLEWIPPDRPLIGLEHRRFVVALPSGKTPVAPPSDQLLAQLMALRSVPLVLSSFPDDALLMRLDPVGRFRAMADGELARGPLGLYRRRAEGWYSISYDATAMRQVASILGWRKADCAGQARMVVEDPHTSRLSDWITAVTADRLRRASLQSAAAMNLITHDLQCTATDSAAATELLLGAEQRCPLGGDWQWVPASAEYGSWLPSSSAGKDPNSAANRTWQWFHGSHATCALHADAFEVLADWQGLATEENPP